MSSMKIKNIINQIDPNAIIIAQQISKKDEEMKKTKRKLEDLRLENEPQNTKLIRIQQDERKATDEYKQKKKDMEKILEELAVRSEKFNEEQKRIYTDLETKRDTVIIKNDLKKKLEDEKCNRVKSANDKKQKKIEELKNEKKEKETELAYLEKEIKRYRVYEDFLKSANENSEDSKNNEKHISDLIQRYEELRKKQEEFGKSRDLIEKEKDQVNSEIARITKEMEDVSYSFTSKITKLKNENDLLIQENRRLEMEIDGKVQNGNLKHSEYGRILLAIRNLYFLANNWKDQPSTKSGNSENEKLDASNDTTEKLITKLNEIKKKMKFLLEVSSEINTKWIDKPTDFKPKN